MAEAWPEASDFMKAASVSMIMVPARTPRDIVNKLNEAIGRALPDPAARDRLEKAGLFPRAPMSIEQVAATLRTSVDAWTRVVTTTGIKDAIKATN